MLGVGSKTTSEAVRGEVGWLPLKARRDILRLKFWGKLVNSKEGLSWEVYLSRNWRGVRRKIAAANECMTY